MRDTVLQFASAQDLWQFKMRIEAHEVKINFGNITLMSRFKIEEIEMAVQEFKAHVKEKPPAS